MICWQPKTWTPIGRSRASFGMRHAVRSADLGRIRRQHRYLLCARAELRGAGVERNRGGPARNPLK